MEKLSLRKYQQEGVNFLVSRPRAFLGDQMGLGKTAQAICALHRLWPNHWGDGRILIICPATLRMNWQVEFKNWWPAATVAIAGLDNDWALSNTMVSIISYNMLVSFHDRLRREEWLAVVCDEAHYLQSLDSQRTIEIRGGWGKSPIRTKRKIAMTGTPLQNRPINLYPILKWLECDFAKKELFFGERYCGGEKQNFRGATNIPELNEKLKSIMLRRTKEEVLGELPPKTRVVVELNLEKSEEKTVRDEEKKILAEANVSFEDVVEGLQRPSYNLNKLDKGVIARIRRNTGVAKIKAAAEHIVEMLESNEKILVFAHHREVIEELSRFITSLTSTRVMPVIVYGGMSDINKNGCVIEFQNRPSCRVFLGQIEAAGVGLTLTAASLVIFVEQDWTPGKNAQAEDRVHRIGQTENVLIQYLILNGTLDAHIARSNVAKQAVLDEVLA